MRSISSGSGGRTAARARGHQRGGGGGGGGACADGVVDPEGPSCVDAAATEPLIVNDDAAIGISDESEPKKKKGHPTRTSRRRPGLLRVLHCYYMRMMRQRQQQRQLFGANTNHQQQQRQRGRRQKIDYLSKYRVPFLLLIFLLLLGVFWRIRRFQRVPHTSFLDHRHYRCPASASSAVGMASSVGPNNNNNNKNQRHSKNNNRRVLFVQIATMESYYLDGNHRYKGGEYYLSACLDYALRENGYTVDRVTTAELVRKTSTHGALTAAITRDYDLIVANGYDAWERLGVVVAAGTPQQADRNRENLGSGAAWKLVTALPPDQLCKLRSISWWGDAVVATGGPLPDHRQYWKPYPQADTAHNAFVGYFPHSLLLMPQSTTTQEDNDNHHRGRVGLLLGKGGSRRFLQKLRPVVDALLAAGFELHATCCSSDDDTENDILPAAVHRHANLDATRYAQLLRRCSFLLGAGRPYDSPSPLEGLAAGVAFLNPLSQRATASGTVTAAAATGGGGSNNRTTTTTTHYQFSLDRGSPPLRSAQHTPLALLGPPHVYNVRLDDAAMVVAAAEAAARHRFASFTPSDYQPLAVTARVCSLLQEAGAVCDAVIRNSINNSNTTAAAAAASTTNVRKSASGYDANQLPGVHFYGKDG